ncbi:MAG: hypothetical protein P8K73_02140 [Methylophilaceae bacterium]|nr:hypothetical protein [Methylophilaceae bacterium]
MVRAQTKQARIIIANRAAEIIMEEGITDYHFAKKKAARYLGYKSSDLLPSNDEIDYALNEYQKIYQVDIDVSLIEKIKNEALLIMELFKNFNPHLLGQLIDGLIPKYPILQINLYTDNMKEIEYLLLNNNIMFDLKDKNISEKRTKKKSLRNIPIIKIDGRCFPIELKILDENDLKLKKNLNIINGQGTNLEDLKKNLKIN